MRPERECVVADIRGDIGKVQYYYLARRNMGNLPHDGTAVDAQHEVARIIALAAGDGGGHRLLRACRGFAGDSE